jgi:hypothetical protein
VNLFLTSEKNEQTEFSQNKPNEISLTRSEKQPNSETDKKLEELLGKLKEKEDLYKGTKAICTILTHIVIKKTKDHCFNNKSYYFYRIISKN